jgi:hypothetical protein
LVGILEEEAAFPKVSTNIGPYENHKRCRRTLSRNGFEHRTLVL